MKLLTTANYHADLQVNLKASHIIKYRGQEKDITINFYRTGWNFPTISMSLKAYVIK